MQYLATSAKSITAAGLVLASPVVLLFSAPLAIGITSDIICTVGSVPLALGFSGLVALFALYRLHHPN